MSFPLTMLRRSRPAGSPTVGREAFLMGQGRGAALARMLCALVVLVICLAPQHRHQPVNLTWQGVSATADAASPAEDSTPIPDAAEAPAETVDDHAAFDDGHGADTALTPRDGALRPPLAATSRPSPRHVLSLTPQTRPLAPTPPPRLPITRFLAV